MRLTDAADRSAFRDDPELVALATEIAQAAGRREICRNDLEAAFVQHGDGEGKRGLLLGVYPGRS